MENFKIARVGLHHFEEPCLSGTRGSGTIFFSGCALKCLFCQNYEISHDGVGLAVTPSQFVDAVRYLEDLGAHNINLVTPSNYTNILVPVLEKIKPTLSIPIVWNSSGYESVANLKKMEGLVDIYMPDFKYGDDTLAFEYSNAKNYSEIATDAITEMRRQCSEDIFVCDAPATVYTKNLRSQNSFIDSGNTQSKNHNAPFMPSQNCFCGDGISNNQNSTSQTTTSQNSYFDGGIMTNGMIVRHLVLPDALENTRLALNALAEIDRTLYISLMCQYFPTKNVVVHKHLGRRLTDDEYDLATEYFFDAGLKNGFSQELSSATEEYVPSFDLDKLKKILNISEN